MTVLLPAPSQATHSTEERPIPTALPGIKAVLPLRWFTGNFLSVNVTGQDKKRRSIQSVANKGNMLVLFSRRGVHADHDVTAHVASWRCNPGQTNY